MKGRLVERFRLVNSAHTTAEEPATDSSPDRSGTPQTVRVGDGPLAGFEGIIVERRASGRYLVQLYQGVYVETSLVRFDALGESK